MGIKAVPTGHATVTVVVVDLVISGLLVSLLTALVIIFLITAMMFRSPYVGLINLIPVAVATLLNFGILSALGIRLGIATAMNSCIGIGIGIDYTIHFMARYRTMLRQRPDPEWAISKTMASSGKAIFFNALVVTAGFMVLLFSVTPPNQSLGLLVALNMVTSFLGAMTVLPAVLTFISPSRIMKEIGRG
jgi:predicted RND superfamily exporter protein